jgi:hypothetical protein
MMPSDHSSLPCRFLVALAVAWAALAGQLQAQYTPDVCMTSNVNCSGGMCTYTRPIYIATLAYSNSAICSPASIFSTAMNPPPVATLMGTGTGPGARCVWYLQGYGSMFMDSYCDMTGGEGLPVELMEFSAKRAEAE